MESVVRGNKSIGASISIQYSTVQYSKVQCRGAKRGDKANVLYIESPHQ